MVGGANLTMRVLDRDRRPVPGARLSIAAHMSHPGMAPVEATVTERANGVYEATLDFSMAGDWVLVVSGALANGTPLSHRIDVPNVRPSG